MAILFQCLMDDPEPWRKALAEHLPDMEFRVWPDVGDVADIEYAIVWRPRPGDLRRYPNLKVILSQGAGVDHIFLDPDLPEGVPIARIVDPDLAAQLSEYVLYTVLHFHRDMPGYAALRRERRWDVIAKPETRHRRVGVMGLGVIGGDAARKLVALGFDVLGWCMPPGGCEGVRVFHGAEGLGPFLSEAEILVCVLPLTDATRGIVNKDTLLALPPGAAVINVARGGHVVDADLLAALDSGHIAGAALDVFNEEPLPSGHPYWGHPKVLMTPHVAGQPRANILTVQIVENIRRARDGLPLLNRVDPAVGF